jgi:hypothetical protein
MLTAVIGTGRESAALQQFAAAYWGVTDLTNGVRGGLGLADRRCVGLLGQAVEEYYH